MTKKETLQIKAHTREIILLFSVPISIILIITAFLYVPRLFAHPTYDFIYCKGYYCDDRFSVDPNGNLQIATGVDTHRYYSSDANLYYYDIQRNTTRSLQEKEAIHYRLDATSKSPDDYTLKQDPGSGSFLFLGGRKRSWSLNKGIISAPLEIDIEYGDETFIGWVLQ